MGVTHERTPLDETDRAVLQLLQRDARHSTAVDIAEAVGVSDGTVRNRISNLEAAGVIEGYVPTINYERAGYQLQVSMECTAPIVDRERLAEAAKRVEGVIDVRELMTGRRNVHVQVVAPMNDDVTRAARKLDELGLDIEDEDLVRHHHHRPFDHFGTEYVSLD